MNEYIFLESLYYRELCNSKIEVTADHEPGEVDTLSFTIATGNHYHGKQQARIFIPQVETALTKAGIETDFALQERHGADEYIFFGILDTPENRQKLEAIAESLSLGLWKDRPEDAAEGRLFSKWIDDAEDKAGVTLPYALGAQLAHVMEFSTLGAHRLREKQPGISGKDIAHHSFDGLSGRLLDAMNHESIPEASRPSRDAQVKIIDLLAQKMFSAESLEPSCTIRSAG